MATATTTVSQASDLFTPLTIRSVTFRNRIAVSPMCMYQAKDGHMTDFHVGHYGTRAVGGAGLVVIEATGVVPEGRISPYCTGLWSDAHVTELARVVSAIREGGGVAGIQLAHAGRKGSTKSPWAGRGAPLAESEGGWPVVAPSALPFSADSPLPKELSIGEIKQLPAAFAAAAQRALKAGVQVIEVHAAHGYLLNEFLSPLSNHRTDEYGGSFDNRIRLLVEVVKAIRGVWPETLPLFVRISATDHMEGGWTPEDSVKLAPLLKAVGVDLIDCSSGGNSALAKYNPINHYQVPYAEAVKKTGILSGAVGMISEPVAASSIIKEGKADMVFLGRALLYNPYWAHHAARTLKRTDTLPWIQNYAWAVALFNPAA